MSGTIHKTRHAEVRLQQRGISDEVIETVLAYGTVVEHRGSTKYYMDGQARRRAQLELPPEDYRRLSDRLNVYLVVNEGTVVTVAKLKKRMRVSKPHKPTKHPQRRRRRLF